MNEERYDCRMGGAAEAWVCRVVVSFSVSFFCSKLFVVGTHFLFLGNVWPVQTKRKWIIHDLIPEKMLYLHHDDKTADDDRRWLHSNDADYAGEVVLMMILAMPPPVLVSH